MRAVWKTALVGACCLMMGMGSAIGAEDSGVRGALLTNGGGVKVDAWPNARLLTETEQLAARLESPRVRVVDMRSEAKYVAGHVPGAVRVAEGPLRDPNDPLEYLPAPDAFAKTMSEAGIGNDTHVMIYDDEGGRSAARLWFALNAYGHEKVSLVNGGWPKWAAEKRPVSQETPQVAAAKFAPRKIPDQVCGAPELIGRAAGVVALDARSPAEYSGEQLSGGAKKAGRVPNAVNVDWRENVEGPNQTFKSAADLKKLYESKGVTPDKEIIVYCASGGRASQSLFTLKLMGYGKIKVYYGSFSDYSNRTDAPVQR